MTNQQAHTEVCETIFCPSMSLVSYDSLSSAAEIIPQAKRNRNIIFFYSLGPRWWQKRINRRLI